MPGYETPGGWKIVWPPVRDGALTLTAAQLRLLFTGMDWTQRGGEATAIAGVWAGSGATPEAAAPAK
jgi:transposase